MTVDHYCYIACERKNRLVSRRIVSGSIEPLEVLKLVAPAEHTHFTRYPSQDALGMLCFISNLNHTFMVIL